MTSTSLLLSIIIVVVVVLFFLLYFHPYKEGSWYQHSLAENYDNIDTEEMTEHARQVINLGNQINDMTPIDHFRVGTVLLINADDPVQAHEHYMQALNQIETNATQQIDNLYVVDRINDYNIRFADIMTDDLPLQTALLACFTNKSNETLEEKKRNWTKDAHNVHDQLVNDSVKSKVESPKQGTFELHSYPNNQTLSYFWALESVIKILDKIKIHNNFFIIIIVFVCFL